MDGARLHGWAVFSAVLLLVVGLFNVIQGIVAWTTPAYFAAGEGDLLIVASFFWWGLLLVVWGAIMALSGIGLFTGQLWARTLGVVVAAVNIFAQLLFLVTFPLWSLAAIAINVLVIYGLTGAWPREPVTPAAYEAGRADARATAPQQAPTGMPGSEEPRQRR